MASAKFNQGVICNSETFGNTNKQERLPVLSTEVSRKLLWINLLYYIIILHIILIFNTLLSENYINDIL